MFVHADDRVHDHDGHTVFGAKAQVSDLPVDLPVALAAVLPDDRRTVERRVERLSGQADFPREPRAFRKIQIGQIVVEISVPADFL